MKYHHTCLPSDWEACDCVKLNFLRNLGPREEQCRSETLMLMDNRRHAQMLIRKRTCGQTAVDDQSTGFMSCFFLDRARVSFGMSSGILLTVITV